MKFVKFEFDGKICFGVVNGEVANGKSVELIDKSLDEIIKGAKFEKSGVALNLSEVRLLAPLERPLGDIICLGINYMDHAKESAKFKGENFDDKREYPVYFSKRINCFVDPYGEICSHCDITEALDYEAEICAVLGKTIRNFSGDASECVFGYTVLNDITARDIQNRHKQFYFGKSLDDTCVIGPCLASELDISSLDIKSFVNGELRQSSNTKNMIFDINYVLKELSKGMTLEAGTMISLGTPSGVGAGFNPPKFLKSGDTVSCEVDGIGRIENMVV